MSFIDLLKRESVCDQIRHRKSDCFCSLEEIKCCSIISQCVYPGTNQVDFFGAEIEVRVDCSISTIDEETKFAKTAAATVRAEGDAEYMRILSEVYDSPEEAEFYTFMIALDALQTSMTGAEKTLILDADSPIAKLFY